MTTKTILMYSLPNCVECKKTEMYFQKHNIEYKYFNLQTNKELLEEIKQEGFGSVPVIKVLNESSECVDSWSGFNVMKLEKYV